MTQNCNVRGHLLSLKKQSDHPLKPQPDRIRKLKIGFPVLLQRFRTGAGGTADFGSHLPDFCENREESVQAERLHQYPYGTFVVMQAVLPIMMNANAFVLGIAQGQFNHYLLTKNYQPESTL